MRSTAFFEHESRLLRVAPFAAAIAVAVVLFPFGTEVKVDAELALAGVLAAATVAAAAILPWELASTAVCLAPVLLYLATLAVLRDVHGGVDSGYSPLVLVPVVWTAMFNGLPLVATAVFCAGLAVALPTALGDETLYPDSDIRRAVVIALLGALIGWLVHRLVSLVNSEMNRRERAEQRLARLRASQIHDDIVQNLTAAQLALALDRGEAVEDGVNRALVSAREVVAELMHEADPVKPGTLRRVEPGEAAAG
jgi:prepilin signal peptidase PulO-like enzyme (type II secretory pathway)